MAKNARVFQSASGQDIVQAVNAVVSIRGGGGQPLFERCLPTTLPDHASASRLLTAASAVVGFVDRYGLVQDLERWVDSPAAFSVRVVGGAGGSGKTRLAVELCHRLAARGGDVERQWVAGFLDAEAGTDMAVSVATLPVPRLVVIDYAESNVDQVAQWLEITSSTLSSAPIRVMLLVRQPGPVPPGRASAESRWITAVRPASSRARAQNVLDGASLVEMDDLPLRNDERGALLSTAVLDLSRQSGGSILSGEAEVPELDSPLYAQPLTLVMAGYLISRGRDWAEMPQTRTQLYDAVLEHEQRYWGLRARVAKLELTGSQLATLVGLGTLVDPEGAAEARALAGLLPFIGTARAHQADEFLSGMYPAPVGDTSRWTPLRPDRLGEYVVALAVDSCPELVGAALDAGRDPDRLLRTLEVLTRSSADHNELRTLTTQSLSDQLMDLTALALAQAADPDRYQSGRIPLPGQLAATVELLGSGVDPRVLMQVSNYLPHTNHIVASLALAVSSTLVQFHRNRATHDADRAFLGVSLNNHALRLAELGRREEALAPSEEAVTLYQELASTTPAAYTPALASSLNNHASLLAELGRRDEALAPSEEAVTLHRALATTSPAAYTPDLASSLNNHARLLASLGRHREAAAVQVELGSRPVSDGGSHSGNGESHGSSG